MKKRKILLILTGVYFTYRFLVSLFFIDSILLGTYYSNNTSSVLEGPTKYGEKLTLNSNDTFESETWGNGKYKVMQDGIFDKRIEFTYKYEFGEAGYSTSISTNFFGLNPKIFLNRDLEFYFEK